jgi:hypothetical protein
MVLGREADRLVRGFRRQPARLRPPADPPFAPAGTIPAGGVPSIDPFGARPTTSETEERMARRSRMSVQKRRRERDKAEKAAMKRETRAQQREADAEDRTSQVATLEDLEGYGIPVGPEDEDASS